MAFAPEIRRTRPEPAAAIRRPRRGLPPARLAGILLLLVWAGPVTFVQTDGPRWLRWLGAPETAAAYPRTIPAGQALVLAPGTPLELRLVDGTSVVGRFLGRDLLADSLYARRYAARSHDAPFPPFALGDTLDVRLVDGRDWVLPFAGYGEKVLLLRPPDRTEPLRVPFEFVREVRGADGETVDPKTLERAFRDGELPSAEAIVLETLSPVGSLADRWEAALRVPAEDIHVALADLPSGGGGNAGTVVGVVVLGVVVGLVLFTVLLGSAIHSSSSGCQYHGAPPRILSDRLTKRAFDIERGCYEGDTLLADAWSGPEAGGPAMAFARIDSPGSGPPSANRNTEGSESEPRRR